MINDEFRRRIIRRLLSIQDSYDKGFSFSPRIVGASLTTADQAQQKARLDDLVAVDRGAKRSDQNLKFVGHVKKLADEFHLLENGPRIDPMASKVRRLISEVFHSFSSKTNYSSSH